MAPHWPLGEIRTLRARIPKQVSEAAKRPMRLKPTERQRRPKLWRGGSISGSVYALFGQFERDGSG
jgi:hypothetical protein